MKTKKDQATADREMRILANQSKFGPREFGIRRSSAKSGILAMGVSLAVVVNPSTATAVTADEAFQMTVSEFENSSQSDKGEVLGYSLNALHNFYVSNGHDKKAECMLELYRTTVEGEVPTLIYEIGESIENANPDHKVTDVITATVEANCAVQESGNRSPDGQKAISD